ncbi:MAG: sigma-54-dependent transcriptional regulator [Desulfovibrio sp.]
MTGNILVVDDEDSIRFSLRGILEDEGYTVEEAGSGEEALQYLKSNRPDMMFQDIWLPGMDGLEVLEQVKKQDKDLPVVMISGHGNIETAVTAIQKGAFDFIEKPLSLEKVIIATEKALEVSRLRRENETLRTSINTGPVDLTGTTEVMQTLRQNIQQVAPTDAWVLITGANGTGKEICARSLHHHSKRVQKPLVAVNCAAIPEELIESELFGHSKGAFTGAEKDKKGKFELADGGTLFLDEIGDMSLKTQAKILRILQEQQFEPVGSGKTISVDVRVFAATNKNLVEEIKEGNFREDLYYRLKVFPLEVPALKDRKEDIPLLIEEFVQMQVKKQGLKPISFTEATMNAIMRYEWPGNVRELRNFVERMLIIFAGKTVKPENLPAEIHGGTQAPVNAIDPVEAFISSCPTDLKLARSKFESAFLSARLKECGGNVTQLAKTIGLERSSLYRKLKTYDLD